MCERARAVPLCPLRSYISYLFIIMHHLRTVLFTDELTECTFNFLLLFFIVFFFCIFYNKFFAYFVGDDCFVVCTDEINNYRNFFYFLKNYIIAIDECVFCIICLLTVSAFYLVFFFIIIFFFALCVNEEEAYNTNNFQQRSASVLYTQTHGKHTDQTYQTTPLIWSEKCETTLRCTHSNSSKRKIKSAQAAIASKRQK